MIISVGLRGVVPITMLNEDLVVGFRYGWIGLYEVRKKAFQKKVLIEHKFIRRILSYFTIISRFYGLNEIKGTPINSTTIYINYHYCFYLYDINKSGLEQIPFIFKGSRSSCLYLTSVPNGVIWGEYGYNPQKTPKSIFFFDKNSKVISKKYTFCQGQVNHIHNLIVDSETSRIWIMTGDFNESAALYYTDDFFKTVNCYKSGSQLYRGCIGASVNNKLYYATDSPDETNFLIKLEDNHLIKLSELNGSCIYGIRDSNKLFFSSTVENEAVEMNNATNKYKYNKGKGIKDWYSYLYSFDIETEELNVITKKKKDYLPMLAFKYGCFRFPTLVGEHSNIMVAYGQSVRELDNHFFIIYQ